MTITILTLFPEMFAPVFQRSILKRAQENKLVTINLVNIRDFGVGKHKVVDDTPYGGGIGMVLRVDVLEKTLNGVKKPNLSTEKQKTYLLDPRGEHFTQRVTESLATLQHLILICGHYEGVDERILSFVDGSISLGEFILTGGEIPAMAVTDAVVRLIPGVLKQGVTENESFSFKDSSQGVTTLEYPQYTKPRVYKNLAVPEILLSGNHKSIAQWRRSQSKQILKKNPLMESQ